MHTKLLIKINKVKLSKENQPVSCLVAVNLLQAHPCDLDRAWEIVGWTREIFLASGQFEAGLLKAGRLKNDKTRSEDSIRREINLI